MTFQFWCPFNLNDISGFVTFQFLWQFNLWHFDLSDISVLVKFQFCSHFTFGDISIQFWSGLVWSSLVWCGDLRIFKGQSNISVIPAFQITDQPTNQLCHYSASPDFFWTFRTVRNMEIGNIRTFSYYSQHLVGVCVWKYNLGLPRLFIFLLN